MSANPPRSFFGTAAAAHAQTTLYNTMHNFAQMLKKNSPSSAAPAREVSADYRGQRLDNYLAREMKGAPRPLIYRLIRTGQVRINGRRAAPDAKLQTGDILRIPDNISLSPPPAAAPPARLPILYEDRALLAVNKPAGIAVHGGSGAAHGIIERLRAGRQDRFLELAHRLDKHTSGILLLAKKSSALRAVQAEWRAHKVQKTYDALVFGQWQKRAARIDLPLKRAARGISGMVAGDGRAALTQTYLCKQFAAAALLRADIATGRTHQLRVHLAAVGLPIIGDDKYGDFAANRNFARECRISGMFLHAARLRFRYGETMMDLRAPPPDNFSAAVNHLEK